MKFRSIEIGFIALAGTLSVLLLAFQNCGEGFAAGEFSKTASASLRLAAQPLTSPESPQVQTPIAAFSPEVKRAALTSSDTLVIDTSSPDTVADVWIKSPANKASRMLRDVPLVGGRITIRFAEQGFSSLLVDELLKDGLMVYVFQKSMVPYLKNPVIAHHNQIGLWDSFYKRTQLQGHLAAGETAFLRAIPAQLTDPSLDFPYVRRGSSTELPFTNKFTLNRVLGGYHPNWFRAPDNYKLHDLVYHDASGALAYRIETLIASIDLYRKRGYALSDITLALENTPWDISKTTCADGSLGLGTYGNRAAPRSIHDWTNLITALANGLKKAYGDQANLLRFKMGSEYNGTEAFCGTQAEYFAMYESAAKTIKRILPGSAFMPGEFAGDLLHSNVDYIELFKFARAKSLPFDGLARSCHNLPYMKPRLTKDVANLCGNDFGKVYASDPNVSPRNLPHEIHQFGTLGEYTIGDLSAYYDFGPRGPAWHFMMAIKLKKIVDLKWLAHWDLASSLGPYENPLISGTWWLYQIYEKFNGLYFQDLEVSTPGAGKEWQSAAFYSAGKLYVVAASFNPNTLTGQTTEDMRIVLPRSLLPDLNPSIDLDLRPYKIAMVELKNGNSPVNQIRDLIKRGAAGLSLKAPYVTNEDLLPKPSQMVVASDSDVSKKIYELGAFLKNNPAERDKFEANTRSLFTLKAADAVLSTNGAGAVVLTSKAMEPSHVRVFEISK